MSGHSKWSTIKREKGAKDAKRGAVFTKLGNQIAIAARGGADPTLNSSLALAIEKAKSANMPMNNIQRAIDRVSDKSAAQLEEIIYEGYGPGGIAIIVEAATDNKNRTYPEVKHAFSKGGGAVAEPGSVMFQFAHRGVITLAVKGDSDELLLEVLDAGAEDALVDGDEMLVYTDMKDMHTVRKALVDAGMTVNDAELQYVASSTVPVDDKETEDKLFRLLETLDDLDDVTNVYNNATFSD
ncbi:MAG: YebC/PmpR family DNA-binding transcriptional regulator [Candidatus Saccharimonadales bacterium]|jgi:YebC/PmpR family DNA-binding regulatory protein